MTDVEEAGTVTVAGDDHGRLVADHFGQRPGREREQYLLAVGAVRHGHGRRSPPSRSNGTASSYRLVAADVGTYLQVTASYSDRRGSGKSASAVTAQITTNNAEPAFSAMTATRTLPENSAPETAVGAPVVGHGTVTANDMDDPRDTLTYSLSGTDASSFSLNTSTGQLSTQDRRHLRLRGPAQLQRHRERA